MTLLGEGDLFYIKASLHSKVLQTKTIDNVDVIFLQLKTHVKKIIIRLIYRPPAHNITGAWGGGTYQLRVLSLSPATSWLLFI